MTNYKDHGFDFGEMKTLTDLRRHEDGIGARREDILDSMLNLILNHKKELRKISACSTLAGAEAWCEKRPGSGFRADTDDIGGDPQEEVVVYDRAGKPMIVNGYMLKPSDFAMRHAYQTAVNKDPEGMKGTSMRNWATKHVWAVEPDEHNMWDAKVTKNSLEYDKMKEWGYRMPSKPKKQVTPYAIFSKLIAPLVDDVLTNPVFYNRFAIVFGIKGVGSSPENQYFINKIVSPISLYRFLYLRLIEQKYYWALTASPAFKKDVKTFEKFKKHMKTDAKTFRKWYINNILTGERKEKFKDGWVSSQAVLDNLIKESIQLDGSDIQDGIVFLLSPTNLNDTEPVAVEYKGKTYNLTFRQLLCDSNAATIFNMALKNKKSTGYREMKRRLDAWKRNADESTKAYFKDPRAQKLFFDTEQPAYEQFMTLIQATGIANATDERSAAVQQQQASSPVRAPPIVQPQAETGDDDDELEGDPILRELLDQGVDKGQKKMTDFFDKQ